MAFYDGFVDKTKKMTDVVKYTQKNSELERKNNDLYATLGRYIHQNMADQMQDRTVQQIFAQIEENNLNIKINTETINRLKGLIPCPGCGTMINEKSVTCNHCGFQLVVPEPITHGPIPLPMGGPSLVCPACGAAAEVGQSFCMSCGTDIRKVSQRPHPEPVQQPSNNVCRNCGHPLEPGVRFCMECGTPVNVVEITHRPTPSVPPEPVFMTREENVVPDMTLAPDMTGVSDRMPAPTPVEQMTYGGPSMENDDRTVAVMPDMEDDDRTMAVMPDMEDDDRTMAVMPDVEDDDDRTVMLSSGNSNSAIEDEMLKNSLDRALDKVEQVLPKKLVCSNCGAELEENMRFCMLCGTPVNK